VSALKRGHTQCPPTKPPPSGVHSKPYEDNMEKDRIIDHLLRLLYVIRYAACHRALSQYKEEFNQNYWILICNNFLDMAILEWCKVFGSNREKTHWEKLVDDHASFQQGLLKALKIDQSGWEAYRKDIKKYRDKFIAHHQKDPNRTHYPHLDISLDCSFYYYNWLINRLKLCHIFYEPDDLKIYYDCFLSQALRFAEMSYDATKGIEERVF
jgi:hypothetical protein